MIEFWERYWLGSVLWAIGSLLLVWLVLLLVAIAINKKEPSPVVTPFERRLAGFQRLARLTKDPIPPLDVDGDCASHLEGRLRGPLAAVDNSTRAVFAPAFVSAQLVFLLGAAQALWTFIAIGMTFTPWQPFAVSILLFTLLPFLFTAGAFSSIRRKRMPFEWAFLESASWASRNLDRITEADPEDRVYVQLRDVERVVVERFRSKKLRDLPSYAHAAAIWYRRVAPLLAAHGLGQTPDGDHAAAGRAWLQQACEVVCHPGIRPVSADADSIRMARVAALSRPRSVFAVSGLIAVVVCAVAAMAVSVILELAATNQVRPDIPGTFGAFAALTTTAGTATTVFVTFRGLLSRPNARLVEALLDAEVR